METTPIKRYKANAKRVKRAEVALAELLAEHRKKAEAKPMDWSPVADLNRVACLLEEAVIFLTSGTYSMRDRNSKPVRVTIPED